MQDSMAVFSFDNKGGFGYFRAGISDAYYVVYCLVLEGYMQ
jgi:hypothetical protein